MEKINIHSDLAVSFIVPYLREFGNVCEVAEISGNRHQTIENAIWYLLSELDVDTANGVWLDYLGEKAGQSRNVILPPTGTFIFDSETLGLDLGLLAETGSGSSVSLNDELYRIIIKYRIAQNNYDGKRDSLINALKIITSGSYVYIRKTDTLKCDLIIGFTPNPSFDYVNLIQDILPQCVELGTLYQHGPVNGFLLDSSLNGLDNGLLAAPL
jgi:hypothetical protein